MTKNNLNKHLSWLFGSSTFVPPPPEPTPQFIEGTLPLSSGSEDPLHEEHAPSTNLQSRLTSTVRNVGVARSLQEPAIPELSNDSLSILIPTTMARLQSAPKSNIRAKLLNQAPHGTAKADPIRPSSSSLRDQYCAAYDDGLSFDVLHCYLFAKICQPSQPAMLMLCRNYN